MQHFVQWYTHESGNELIIWDTYFTKSELDKVGEILWKFGNPGLRNLSTSYT